MSSGRRDKTPLGSGIAEPGTAEPGIAEPGTAEPGIAERQLGSPSGKSRAGARRSQLGSSQPHPRGWYSRGYLPHCDHPGLLQVVTYRLADSLPAEALARMEAELRLTDPGNVDATRRKKIDAWLDAGHGSCILRNSDAASMVVENWRHFAEKRYDLIAFVVMPNHVHLLIRVYEGMVLGKIVQSWKSYTGRRIAAIAPRIAERPLGSPSGKSRAGARRSQGVWMREYWDRYIRSETHFSAAIEYIHQNPVKAGLVERPENWEWSSAKEYGPGIAER